MGVQQRARAEEGAFGDFPALLHDSVAWEVDLTRCTVGRFCGAAALTCVVGVCGGRSEQSWVMQIAVERDAVLERRGGLLVGGRRLFYGRVEEAGQHTAIRPAASSELQRTCAKLGGCSEGGEGGERGGRVSMPVVASGRDLPELVGGWARAPQI